MSLNFLFARAIEEMDWWWPRSRTERHRFQLIGEFKKLPRQLRWKRHIKIEVCLKSSLLRFFNVGHVVQTRRSALSLGWHDWFSCKGREWKIYCCELALSSDPQIWKSVHVAVWQTTSKHCTKKRAARAARLFFFIQPIKSLICGVVVDVASLLGRTLGQGWLEFAGFYLTSF